MEPVEMSKANSLVTIMALLLTIFWGSQCTIKRGSFLPLFPSRNRLFLSSAYRPKENIYSETESNLQKQNGNPSSKKEKRRAEMRNEVSSEKGHHPDTVPLILLNPYVRI